MQAVCTSPARRKGKYELSGCARIGFGAAAVIMPAETPYEREELLDTVRHLTKRCEEIRLDLNGQEWNVTRLNGPLQACGACGRTISELSYRLGRRPPLCTRCAERALTAVAEGARLPDGRRRSESSAQVRRGVPSRDQQKTPPPAL